MVQARWIEPGQRVPDLGTGTGSLAFGFARRGMDVTGLDLSTDLVEVARHSAIDEGLTARFVVGRAEQTGLPDAVFDVVSARTVLVVVRRRRGAP